ncbi:KGK domain-containing protein [Anabaena sp. PCC 7108]|uniref:KGK domain-containing protein n=1 Tax=Anabaena sp. PCC 7108 TaxID=163908 RepID=UPI00034CEB05|nr:KGK domain-containing protein [Anabaena sp. PCC 7108]
MVTPSDDDVINFPQSPGGWDLSTGKVSAVLKEIADTANGNRDGGQLVTYLVREGAACEFLSINGGGWRKGKVKLRMEFEFIPDEPESVSLPPVKPESPLDDLRAELLKNE